MIIETPKGDRGHDGTQGEPGEETPLGALGVKAGIGDIGVRFFPVQYTEKNHAGDPVGPKGTLGHTDPNNIFNVIANISIYRRNMKGDLENLIKIIRHIYGAKDPFSDKNDSYIDTDIRHYLSEIYAQLELQNKEIERLRNMIQRTHSD